MLEMYATGTFAIDATDPRNQFNERALHEARIATDYRQYASSQPRRGLLARIRAALPGAPVVTTTQACSCPA
jgi:hypothetical protein